MKTGPERYCEFHIAYQVDAGKHSAGSVHLVVTGTVWEGDTVTFNDEIWRSAAAPIATDEPGDILRAVNDLQERELHSAILYGQRESVRRCGYCVFRRPTETETAVHGTTLLWIGVPVGQ